MVTLGCPGDARAGEFLKSLKHLIWVDSGQGNHSNKTWSGKKKYSGDSFKVERGSIKTN